MLSNDLSEAKVIDFSYSTPLNLDELSAAPANSILSKWLSSTPQFTPPESTIKDRVPMVDDFSKIDVWALAVLLMNMLTDDYAWPNILDGYN